MEPSIRENSGEFVPATQSELMRLVAENADGERHPLVPVGGRTSLNFGYPIPDSAVRISTARLTNVVDYPARDMTITVEAGIRIDELSKLLEAQNQWIPVDVAQSHRATMGGVVATNTSGPRRFGCGTIRDYVIGVSAVDSTGRLFSSGGRVVKNVAGYDLCKLLIGSLGTLAIITQLTLKLRPRPTTSALVWITCESLQDVDELLESLVTARVKPVAIEVLNPRSARHISSEARCDLPHEKPVVCIGFDGTENEVTWQMNELKVAARQFSTKAANVLIDDDAPPMWDALTEFPTYSEDPLTFKANLLPSATLRFIEVATSHGVTAKAHAGNGIVIGHLSDEVATLKQATQCLDSLRQLARQGQGDLVVLQCDLDWKRELSVFGDSRSDSQLMTRLKAELDPDNLLSPGRLGLF